MRLSALASFCTSLLAAAALAGDAPLDPARVTSVELEARLARQPDLYLFLDPPRRVLEVKARGIVLDAVPVQGIELVSQQRLLGGGAPPQPLVPAVWKVEEGPGDTDREVIDPGTLRPYVNPDEEEDEPDEAPASGPPRPAATPTPVPEPPASFRSRLDNGWDLWITEELPPASFWQRYWAAVCDGWERLRGFGTDYRPAVTIAVARADAQRLHHLMRKGTPLLVAAGAP